MILNITDILKLLFLENKERRVSQLMPLARGCWALNAGLKVITTPARIHILFAQSNANSSNRHPFNWMLEWKERGEMLSPEAFLFAGAQLPKEIKGKHKTYGLRWGCSNIYAGFMSLSEENSPYNTQVEKCYRCVHERGIHSRRPQDEGRRMGMLVSSFAELYLTIKPQAYVTR